jgi:hypothetical protein
MLMEMYGYMGHWDVFCWALFIGSKWLVLILLESFFFVICFECILKEETDVSEGILY